MEPIAPEPSTAIRLIMRGSVTPAPSAPGRGLGAAASDQAAADDGPRGQILRGRARLEQPLGEVVFLRPPPLLAEPRAVALDLALEHRERLLEGQAGVLRPDVRGPLATSRRGSAVWTPG